MDGEESTVLSSWKDIARYLGKGVRTVQRWERELGLPVRRPIGASQKSAVLLHRGDVDAWLATRFSARPVRNEKALVDGGAQNSPIAALRAQIRKGRELRDAQLALAQQLSESIRRLSERCDLLATESLQPPWLPARAGVRQLLPQTEPVPAEGIS